MDADLKAKWIEALRSGEFVQGTGTLKKHEDGIQKHCCLGILWEVAGNTFNEPTEDGDCAYYPKENNKEGGAYHQIEKMINPDFEVLGEAPTDNCYRLWGMNDKGRKTFAEIADYIQETY